LIINVSQFLSKIRNTYEGFAAFIELFDRARGLAFDSLTLDMEGVVFVDANLSAVLSAILSHITCLRK
jgi:hypothetical protein